jgi:hypothetical protein
MASLPIELWTEVLWYLPDRLHELRLVSRLLKSIIEGHLQLWDRAWYTFAPSRVDHLLRAVDAGIPFEFLLGYRETAIVDDICNSLEKVLGPEGSGIGHVHPTIDRFVPPSQWPFPKSDSLRFERA